MKMTLFLRKPKLLVHIFLAQLLLSLVLYISTYFLKLEMVSNIIFLNLTLLGLLHPILVLFQRRKVKSLVMVLLTLLVTFGLQSEIFRISLDDPTGYGAIIFPGFVGMYSLTFVIMVIVFRSFYRYLRKLWKGRK